MEANVCDVNHLDSDVLLPPRKRLLACFKKQNGNINGNSHPPSTCTPLNKLDTQISYLLRAHLSNDNPSQEEIVAASKSAAEVAVKVAMAARSAAEEKEVIAAKAMAAAKKALELEAIVDDTPEKQVEVQMLYNNKSKTNNEELARKLHQAINSSPNISKTGVVPSDSKIHKHKMPKTSENGGINNGSMVENMTISRRENGDAERKVKGDEEMNTFGRKRGRMKQKKLPLSICHDRDQANPKEDLNSKKSLSVGTSGNNVVVERNLWKCQAFKASPCVKQNKLMQL